MKDHSQTARLGFALKGLRAAWRLERSFRTEVFVLGAVIVYMALTSQPPAWWALAAAAASLALMAELVNTAIEAVCDALHPERHPLIGTAKDCASAAVLIANLFAIGVLVAMAAKGMR